MKEMHMASSEKKRAREQSAAARRDRVTQKRIEKQAASGEATAPYSPDEESLEPIQEAGLPAEPEK